MAGTRNDPPEEPLDELDAEVVEDLEAEPDADAVRGGTIANTGGCGSVVCPVR